MIEHLARGLRILGKRWAAGPRAWIAAGENWLDTGVRIGMVGGGGYVLWHLVAASWKVLGAAILVVAVKALRAATRAVTATPQTATPAPDPAGKGPVALSPQEFTGAIWEALGDSKAVHLATLSEHFTQATGDPWTADDVRTACRALDIPIRPKVRDLGGDRVSSGVHRDDLPPLPRPLPEEAQEWPVGDYTAGQDGNAAPLQTPHATTATPTTRRVGDLRITSVPDAVNPHRTHVQVADPTRKQARR